MESVFLKEFAQRLLVLAAAGDSDYAMVDGVLKKGQWKTLPNHVHVFIVDGKIEAGPQDTIGKKIDELNVSEVVKKDEEQSENPHPIREAVTDKYKPQIMAIQNLKRADTRKKEYDKIMRKMTAEDDFHVIFLDAKKPSPVLEQLTKDFADFGSFPVKGTFQDQVVFYKDRLQLLNELANSLPETAQSNDIQPQMEHIRDLLSKVIAEGPKDTASDALTVTPDSADATMPQINQAPEDVSSVIKPIGPNPRVLNPGRQKQTRVVNPRSPGNKAPQSSGVRAKTSIMMTIEAILKSLFMAMVAAIAKYIANSKSMAKSTGAENRLLYSVTNKVLSNINVSKQDNFFTTFGKQFQRHST